MPSSYLFALGWSLIALRVRQRTLDHGRFGFSSGDFRS